MARNIFILISAGILLLALLPFESCKKKPDVPKMELIASGAPNGDSNVVGHAFPKITLTVKNTGDLNAYNVACGVIATRNDTVVSTDTVTFTQTYIKPFEIDTAQAWLFNLKSFKQFDHVTYVLYWWDVNSVFYSKSY